MLKSRGGGEAIGNELDRDDGSGFILTLMTNRGSSNKLAIWMRLTITT